MPAATSARHRKYFCSVRVDEGFFTVAQFSEGRPVEYKPLQLAASEFAE